MAGTVEHRLAARYPETIDTSTHHVGFRLIVRLPAPASREESSDSSRMARV